jgi:hypothetical protein
LGEKYEAKIKEDTLFLLRNAYEPTLSPINFDIYIQSSSILFTYLHPISTVSNTNFESFKTALTLLGPSQTCLLYLYDKNETIEKQRERMLTAKYIELELTLNGMEGIKLYALEKAEAVHSGLLNADWSRTNSVHLVRKHN